MSSVKVENPFVMELKGTDGYIGYFGVHRHIQRASYFVSKVTRESVDISLSDKMVLYYLIDQVGHHRNISKPCTQSMTEIAVNLGMNDRTVSRAVKKLIEHKVISGSVMSKGGSYTYTDVDVHQTFTTEVSAAVQERMKPNPINVQAPVVTSETIADTTPDVGIPDHMNAPDFDYSDVRNDVEDDQHTARHVSNVLDFDDFGDVVGFP